MLNVHELREKLHAARHKDTEVAYVARKWMGKVLDELEAAQNEIGELQSVIAAQEIERRRVSDAFSDSIDRREGKA